LSFLFVLPNFDVLITKATALKNQYIMKYSILLITTVILTLSVSVSAQKFQGTVQYSSKSKVHILINTEGFNEKMKEKFKTGYDASSRKQHVLEFNKNQSLFTEKKEVNINPSRGMRSNPKGPALMINFPGNYYKDLTAKTYVNQKEFFGRQFIIRNTLKAINWKKENEIKIIGKYTCFKATTKITKENGETTDVVAWYTIDIPVQEGPGKFWGLPGLILEVQTEDVVYTCTKIALNKTDSIAIQIPKKGKKISSEKFEKLFVSTLKEIKERHAN
jgi:GLPGLI family protein